MWLLDSFLSYRSAIERDELIDASAVDGRCPISPLASPPGAPSPLPTLLEPVVMDGRLLRNETEDDERPPPWTADVVPGRFDIYVPALTEAQSGSPPKREARGGDGVPVPDEPMAVY